MDLDSRLANPLERAGNPGLEPIGIHVDPDQRKVEQDRREGTHVKSGARKDHRPRMDAVKDSVGRKDGSCRVAHRRRCRLRPVGIVEVELRLVLKENRPIRRSLDDLEIRNWIDLGDGERADLRARGIELAISAAPWAKGAEREEEVPTRRDEGVSNEARCHDFSCFDTGGRVLHDTRSLLDNRAPVVPEGKDRGLIEDVDLVCDVARAVDLVDPLIGGFVSVAVGHVEVAVGTEDEVYEELRRRRDRAGNLPRGRQLDDRHRVPVQSRDVDAAGGESLGDQSRGDRGGGEDDGEVPGKHRWGSKRIDAPSEQPRAVCPLESPRAASGAGGLDVTERSRAFRAATD